MSASVLGIALCLVEAGLRVSDLPSRVPAFLGSELDGRGFVADDELFWRLAPGARNINAAGLGGWWPIAPKREGELRIVCVGDSCTFGTEASYEESYGIRLERLVQAEFPGISARTVLLALPGYSTYQNRILVEKYLAFLAPDVTIFYCGPWNDFVPALAVPDAEYAVGTPLGTLRLGKLVESVFHRSDSAAREELVEAFRRGEAPHGRRVPLPDFRDNMRAMIESARAIDSRTIVVLPARPERTRSDYPIADRYSEALREMSGSGVDAVVDAQALFDAYLEGLPEPWARRDFFGVPLSICYADWIHPTVLGHSLLADKLLETLREAGVMQGISRIDGPPAGLTVSPDSVSALRPGTVELQGAALDQEGALERIWIGNRWIRSPVRVGAGRVRLELPEGLRSGREVIEVSSPAGGCARVEVLVQPPGLEVEMRLSGDELKVSATVLGPPGWRTSLWVSTGRRPAPAPTVYGPFHLVAEPDGRPPGRDEMPFRFEHLTLPAYTGTVDERGRWDLQRTTQVDAAAVPDLVFLQAGIVDPDGQGGALTEVVELRIR